MPTRIASMDLRASDVPGDVRVGEWSAADDTATDETGILDVVAFAQTFNGYAWGGAPHRLGATVAAIQQRWLDNDVLPTDLDQLRACLFYWVRAQHHGDGEPLTPTDTQWLNALLAAIRDVLATRT